MLDPLLAPSVIHKIYKYVIQELFQHFLILLVLM